MEFAYSDAFPTPAPLRISPLRGPMQTFFNMDGLGIQSRLRGLYHTRPNADAFKLGSKTPEPTALRTLTRLRRRFWRSSKPKVRSFERSSWLARGGGPALGLLLVWWLVCCLETKKKLGPRRGILPVPIRPRGKVKKRPTKL